MNFLKTSHIIMIAVNTKMLGHIELVTSMADVHAEPEVIKREGTRIKGTSSRRSHGSAGRVFS